MRPFASMLQHMEPLGIYNLKKPGSLVAAELFACAEVLNLAYDGLLETEREAYFSSAQSWGFEGKCAALGIADGGEWSRAAGLQLLKVRPGHCTRADFVTLAEALGLGGMLYERFHQPQVLFCPAQPPQDCTFAKKILRRLLPAQLEAALDLRGKNGTWAGLDAATRSWVQQDAQGQTWAETEKDVVLF